MRNLFDKQYFDALSQYQITDTIVARLLEVARVKLPFEIVELALAFAARKIGFAPLVVEVDDCVALIAFTLAPPSPPSCRRWA